MFKTQAGNGEANLDKKPLELDHFVDLKMLRVVNAPDIVPKVNNRSVRCMRIKTLTLCIHLGQI